MIGPIKAGKPRIYRVGGKWYCAQDVVCYGCMSRRLGIASNTPKEAFDKAKKYWS